MLHHRHADTLSPDFQLLDGSCTEGVCSAQYNALAITKLDGTAKGGVVIGISDQFKVPVKYIGLGEKIEDLQVFRKREFVDSIFGDEL